MLRRLRTYLIAMAAFVAGTYFAAAIDQLGVLASTTLLYSVLGCVVAIIVLEVSGEVEERRRARVDATAYLLDCHFYCLHLLSLARDPRCFSPDESVRREMRRSTWAKPELHFRNPDMQDWALRQFSHYGIVRSMMNEVDGYTTGLQESGLPQTYWISVSNSAARTIQAISLVPEKYGGFRSVATRGKSASLDHLLDKFEEQMKAFNSGR